MLKVGLRREDEGWLEKEGCTLLMKVDCWC